MKINFEELEQKYFEGIECVKCIDVVKNAHLIEKCSLFLIEMAKFLKYAKNNTYTQRDARKFINAINDMIENVDEINGVSA